MVPRKEQQRGECSCWNIWYTVDPSVLNAMHNSKLSAIMWACAAACLLALKCSANTTIPQNQDGRVEAVSINKENKTQRKEKKKNIQKMLVLFTCPLSWTYIVWCYTGQLGQFKKKKGSGFQWRLCRRGRHSLAHGFRNVDTDQTVGQWLWNSKIVFSFVDLSIKE